MKLIQTYSKVTVLPTERHPDSLPDASIPMSAHLVKEAWQALGDSLCIPMGAVFDTPRRLVVLFPEGRLDENALVSKVWRLASFAALPVLYLGLTPDPDHLPFLRRQLAMLTARTSQGLVRASGDGSVGTKWEQALAEVRQPGDLLVCVSDFWVPYRLFGQRRLGERLSRNLDVPVYQLEGLSVIPSPRRLERVKGLLSLGITLAILLVFGVFQVWMEQEDTTWMMTVLLSLTVVLEIIAILKINEWIG